MDFIPSRGSLCLQQAGTSQRAASHSPAPAWLCVGRHGWFPDGYWPFQLTSEICHGTANVAATVFRCSRGQSRYMIPLLTLLLTLDANCLQTAVVTSLRCKRKYSATEKKILAWTMSRNFMNRARGLFRCFPSRLWVSWVYGDERVYHL